MAVAVRGSLRLLQMYGRRLSSELKAFDGTVAAAGYCKTLCRQGDPVNWQDEHMQNVASFPDDVRDAHAHSSNHRAELVRSAQCGCFYCCAAFPPSEVLAWVDEDANGEGQTALCPRCGIDSVIGDASGFEIRVAFLETMRKHWF